ncbi:MAG: hypothetical protein Q4D66_04445 [Bacteroidales bacterium]|nr:hypothetical protein [Bacteroidales bacterium]
MYCSFIRLLLLNLLLLCNFLLLQAQAPTTSSTAPSPRVGIGTRSATEMLDVDGTVRLRKSIREKGTLIRTQPDGTASPTENQFFKPTHSVWANSKGVLGRHSLPADFFYLPPMLLPIYPVAAGDITSYDTATKTFHARIHEAYRRQFVRDNNGRSISSTPLRLPLYAARDLDYYVNYYDASLFHSVSVNAEGILSYQVHPGVLPTEHSYFSIVLRIK